jgi:hypothetical protein
MSTLKRFLFTLLAVLILGAATLATVEAQTANSPGARPAGVVIPDGFRKLNSTFGVRLFRKDYPGGTPDFVQVVDFSQGASIELLHGPIREERPGQGAYGGDDPRILSRSLRQYWNELAASAPNPFCVINGQFFYMPESPTRLPFPLKVNGEILSEGFGRDQFPGKKLMLELWPGRADINLLTPEALHNSTAPDIVAGLAEDAPKNIKKYVGRTFVGVADKDSDDVYETLFIFATRSARQADAAQVLRSFGAQKVMMLDGGGSTQMICQDNPVISSDRLIPQALGVKGGIPPTPKFRDPVEISAGPAVVKAQAIYLPLTASRTVAPATPIQQEVAQAEASASPIVQVASLPVAPQPEAAVPAAPEKVLTLAHGEPAQDASPKPLYDLSSALWVPGMMAPAFAFIFLIVLRMRLS